MHKCREAQAPETPVDIGRQENDEANDDIDNEACEDIVLLKTEMFRKIKQSDWAYESRSFSLHSPIIFRAKIAQEYKRLQGSCTG